MNVITMKSQIKMLSFERSRPKFQRKQVWENNPHPDKRYNAKRRFCWTGFATACHRRRRRRRLRLTNGNKKF